MRHDVEPRSPSQTVSQPLRSRLRRESDHALCQVSRPRSRDLIKRKGKRSVHRALQPPMQEGHKYRPGRHGDFLTDPPPTYVIKEKLTER
jgi:hypothetical protein